MKQLRTAVIGVGHLGQHHARIYAGLPEVELVAVADTDEARAREIAGRCRTEALADWRSLIGKVDAVSLAVPTRDHFAIARELLAGGVAVLVEKPLTRTLEEADQLLAVARQSGAVLQVGHVERFNPVLAAVLDQPDLKPLFIETDRISPFKFRSADIGVVLDLMIHDLDIVLFLAGAPIEQVDAVGVSVISRREDIANARIRFAGGCVANLTASRIALKTMRQIRVFSSRLYVSLDLDQRRGLIYRPAPGLDLSKVDVEQLDAGSLADRQNFVFGKLVQVEEIKPPDEEPLARELAAFVASVRDGTPPVVSGEHGRLAIAAADQIVDSINRQLRRTDQAEVQT